MGRTLPKGLPHANHGETLFFLTPIILNDALYSFPAFSVILCTSLEAPIALLAPTHPACLTFLPPSMSHWPKVAQYLLGFLWLKDEMPLSLGSLHRFVLRARLMCFEPLYHLALSELKKRCDSITSKNFDNNSSSLSHMTKLPSFFLPDYCAVGAVCGSRR